MQEALREKKSSELAIQPLWWTVSEFIVFSRMVYWLWNKTKAGWTVTKSSELQAFPFGWVSLCIFPWHVIHALLNNMVQINQCIVLKGCPELLCKSSPLCFFAMQISSMQIMVMQMRAVLLIKAQSWLKGMDTEPSYISVISGHNSGFRTLGWLGHTKDYLRRINSFFKSAQQACFPYHTYSGHLPLSRLFFIAFFLWFRGI